MLWRLWAIWDVTGRDPYRVYHSLDDDYTPVEGGVPIPPSYPGRLQEVIYAFARYSQDRKEQLAGVKKRPVRKQRKREGG